MKKLFNQLGWFIRYYRWRYLLSILAILLSYGIMLLPPRLIGLLTDQISNQTLTLTYLKDQLLLFLGITVISFFVGLIWGFFLFSGSDHLQRLLTNRLFDRLLKQGPGFYSHHTTGSLMGKATNDISATVDMMGYGIMSLLDSTIYPLVVIVIMVSLSPLLTVCAVLPLVLLIILCKNVGKKLYPAYDEAQKAFDDMNEAVLEIVSGVRVIRAYHQEEAQRSRFSSAADQLFQKNMKAVRYSQLYEPLTIAIPAISISLTLLLGIRLILSGQLTIGQLISFSIYLEYLVWPAVAFGEFMNTFQQGVTSMDRISEVLEEPLSVEDVPEPVSFPNSTPLEINHLSFTYPQDQAKGKALEDIQLSLLEGKTLGIVGPVGCGKTTFLKQFLHLYPLDPGTIEIGHTDLNSIQRSELHEQVGYVSQQGFLFSRSIRDNILLGASDSALQDGSADRRLEEVLDEADFRKELTQFPQGLDTVVGEKGITLSGGQRQRICLARTLMRDNQVLILDDCLSAVDAVTEEHILKTLHQVTKGRTTLIATHRLSALRDADYIIVLNNGQIAEQGTHEQLLKLKGWYAEQYQLQQMEEVSHE